MKQILTDLAFLEVTPGGLVLREIAPGTTVEDVRRATEAKLVIPGDLREIRAA